MNRVSSSDEPTSLPLGTPSELLVVLTAVSELCRATGELPARRCLWPPRDVDASVPLGPAEVLPPGTGSCSEGLFVEEFSEFGESFESVRSIRTGVSGAVPLRRPGVPEVLRVSYGCVLKSSI